MKGTFGHGTGKMYFLLQLKRAVKKYPSILFMTLVTLACVLFCTVLFFATSKSDDTQKLPVGVVGNTSDSFLGMGIDIIKTIDDSKYYIDIISFDKEGADKALDRGEIIGYIEIPEDFILHISSMDNIPAVYYLPNRPESLGTSLAKEVMDTVAMYITGSQKAVAGLSGYIRANGLKYGKTLDELSITIMTNVILNRGRLYETEYTGIAGHISTGGYYLSGMLLFFLLLWSISCSPYLLRKDTGLSALLRSRGVTSVRQVLCEYTVYLMMTAVTLILLSCAFGVAVCGRDTGIREIVGKGTFDCVMYIVQILPVLLAVTSMQFFMYEAVRGIAASLLCQFLTAVISAYVCGLFYPNYFFPKLLRDCVMLLPQGASFRYMRDVMTGNAKIGTLVLLGIYTLLFITLSVMIRKKRTEGGAS